MADKETILSTINKFRSFLETRRRTVPISCQIMRYWLFPLLKVIDVIYFACSSKYCRHDFIGKQTHIGHLWRWFARKNLLFRLWTDMVHSHFVHAKETAHNLVRTMIDQCQTVFRSCHSMAAMVANTAAILWISFSYRRDHSKSKSPNREMDLVLSRSQERLNWDRSATYHGFFQLFLV